MATAALPGYLKGREKLLESASAGLRFGMYLNVWEEGSYARVGETKHAFQRAIRLDPRERALVDALLSRQEAQARHLQACGALLRLHAEATAPFSTGLGNEHPLENGFSFLNPYGLPYLPGSGVKGVLRTAARELAEGTWGIQTGWSAARKPRPLRERGERRELSDLEVLFGHECKGDDTEQFRGVLSFWDVIPSLKSLQVEVMTPHQTHYYQRQESPHDSGDPNPVLFLAVPPGSKFRFNVACDLGRLGSIAPELLEDARWQALVREAFELAFDWLGFGAKTAVGYGAMQHDEAAQANDERRQKEFARETARAAMDPVDREIEAFIETMRNRAEASRGRKERLHATTHQKAKEFSEKALQATDWTPEQKRRAAEAIETWLPQVVELGPRPKDELKKLKLNQLKGLA